MKWTGSNLKNMWGNYSIEKDKTHHWKLGDTDIWVRKIDKEWLIASKTRSENENQDLSTVDSGHHEGLEWFSIVTDKSMSLTVLPALPDRPVVVKPKSVFNLLPNMSIQLYIHIPLWIQFYQASHKSETLLYELPGIGLSSTWFGNTDNGVLSYTNPKEVFTRLDTDSLHPYEAICPVKITNKDTTMLNFQRLLINVELLSLYSHKQMIYTGEIKVIFKGENVVADIQYVSSAPSFIENARHLSKPRNTERKNVLRKSFHFIKSLTDY